MSNLKPILFNTAMVQAILDGRKTTTRRIAKGLKDATKVTNGDFKWSYKQSWMNDLGLEIYAPYHIGDILYVRETFQQLTDENGINYIYKASGDYSDIIGLRWIPSIHMPKKAARIFLKVTDVRVERLQDIDYEGCKSEGVKAGYDGWLGEWSSLWDSTVNKKDIDKYGWNANPYVWVIEFLKIDKSDIGMVK